MKDKDDLRFINWMKATERVLGTINDKIADSQQHEDLSAQEVKFTEKLHKLYWSGEITFDKKNLDSSKLKVNS